ncbi:spore protease YyaC [Mesobacillus subterraneus]|jgi:putative sporulation protein YyaC|uniref:spore protease YyaC n=1 Tax=Mesobacillus subterraneus TaxID=285983 RepID=UPI002040CC5E|nr:spore protease YyaC [Mesobacillus subterraneus]MCM3664455.1 spore protease YyaC [Mesobacillus subterraneus]MCM3684028.1 spore protease YyaC [Mesobacillus subterraneus]
MNLKNHFFERKNSVAKINHEDDLAAEKLAGEILDLLPNLSARPIVFVCIGTDRSTGDSLGPLIGTLLQEKDIAPYHVYGTLDDPIHAVNMEEKLAEIKQKHFNPFIIGIDACLGRLKSVGSIQVGNGPVKPGAGVNKDLPEVGNMHITGIVNVSGFMEFFVLQNTRLNLVLKMAKTIANGISESSLQFPKKQEWPKLSWDLETEQPTVAE